MEPYARRCLLPCAEVWICDFVISLLVVGTGNKPLSVWRCPLSNIIFMIEIVYYSLYLKIQMCLVRLTELLSNALALSDLR